MNDGGPRLAALLFFLSFFLVLMEQFGAKLRFCAAILCDGVQIVRNRQVWRLV